MSLLAEVAAVIRAGVADLNAVVATLYVARTKLDQARRRLVTASEGATDSQLPYAGAKLAQAAGRADESATLILRGAEALARYSTDAMGFPLASDGSASGAGAFDNPAPPAGAAAPRWVASMAEALLPLLPSGSKTAGILATADGKTRSKPIWSGVQGPGANAPGLRRDDKTNQWHRLKSAVEHVEGHVAAIMRRGTGPKDAVLVVSQPPCPGPYGCATILPALLPAGSRLAVYVVGTDGRTRYWKTYTGTGEATIR
ncbi:DddA-like double-stranded DNA deaminase toxin [Plantactinospora sp. ZYX-F-223]|uniref:DddA-like double-stranded DNA deaminase toxin n=1 Tax=Plantactinospora sp. ZYX-F-223 TaxID=3144103 RepID=UPI0031FE2B32